MVRSRVGHRLENPCLGFSLQARWHLSQNLELNHQNSLCPNWASSGSSSNSSSITQKWHEDITSEKQLVSPTMHIHYQEMTKAHWWHAHATSGWCQVHHGWCWRYLEDWKPEFKLGWAQGLWGSAGRGKGCKLETAKSSLDFGSVFGFVPIPSRN